jgi:hypothetical protein
VEEFVTDNCERHSISNPTPEGVHTNTPSHVVSVQQSIAIKRRKIVKIPAMYPNIPDYAPSDKYGIDVWKNKSQSEPYWHRVDNYYHFDDKDLRGTPIVWECISNMFEKQQNCPKDVNMSFFYRTHLKFRDSSIIDYYFALMSTYVDPKSKAKRRRDYISTVVLSTESPNSSYLLLDLFHLMTTEYSGNIIHSIISFTHKIVLPAVKNAENFTHIVYIPSVEEKEKSVNEYFKQLTKARICQYDKENDQYLFPLFRS